MPEYQGNNIGAYFMHQLVGKRCRKANLLRFIDQLVEYCKLPFGRIPGAYDILCLRPGACAACVASSVFRLPELLFFFFFMF